MQVRRDGEGVLWFEQGLLDPSEMRLAMERAFDWRRGNAPDGTFVFVTCDPAEFVEVEVSKCAGR